MALATYTDLQANVASWLNRTDVPVTDCIALFEVRARRELRDWLRTTVTASNVTADYLVPATVSDVLSVSYHDGTSGAHNFQLDRLTKEEYQGFMEAQSAIASVSGQAFYADVDVDAGTTTLRFWPPAGTTAPIANLLIEAIKVLPSLSVSQATNALLRDAPDAYLFGSCAESAKFLQHDERIATWEAGRDQAFRALRIQTERRLYGGAPRRPTLARVFG